MPSRSADLHEPKVALLGTGAMGVAIGRNILRGGYELTVWNRTASKANPLAAAGASIATAPAQAVKDADIVIAVLLDDAASRAVWLGDYAAMEALSKQAVIVECGTLSVKWIEELAAYADGHGVMLLDAPLVGSHTVAAAGELEILVGGRAEALTLAREVLQTFGSVQHVGKIGQGATLKLVSNLLLGAQVAALAESIAIAKRAGLDADVLRDRLIQPHLGGGELQVIAEKMLNEDFSTTYSLPVMVKDLRYGLALAADLGIDTPTAQRAADWFKQALAANLAEEDIAAIIKVLSGKA